MYVLIHHLYVRATTNKHTIKRLVQVASDCYWPYRCPYLVMALI